MSRKWIPQPEQHLFQKLGLVRGWRGEGVERCEVKRCVGGKVWGGDV